MSVLESPKVDGLREIVETVAADREPLLGPDVSGDRRGSPLRSAAAFAGGLVANLLTAAAAFRKSGTGEWGLRAATRSTGQSGLVFYLPFFAGRALHQLRPSGPTRWLARHRETFLQAYIGGHVVHVPLIATLMRRHGHPQRGTYMYYLSVYGGSVGYAGLLTLLALGPPSRAQRSNPWLRHLAALAEWYVIIGPHGVPTVDAYRFKHPSLALYALPVTLWTTAVGARAAAMLKAAGRARH